MSRNPKQPTVGQILGQHPEPPHPCGVHLVATDGSSVAGIPHRRLDDGALETKDFVNAVAAWLVTHHASHEMIERDRLRRETLIKLGLPDPVQRLPTNLNTQKGNWAEILLAEYLQASCPISIPVYRLRWNPNVDQSMKGDDVLAFDLDADPIRIVIGEAKYRGTASAAAVKEITSALKRSHSGTVPASLQFVADRLFELGQNEFGFKVANCNALFAQGRLQLDYVGLLISDANAHRFMANNAASDISRLAVISIGLTEAEALIEACYKIASDSILAKGPV